METQHDEIPVGRLADDIGFLGSRFSWLALRVSNEALAPFDLNARQYAALELSTIDGGTAQREFGRILCLDPSAVVSLVDELVEHRLAIRKQDASDRRRFIVIATPAGKALAEAAAGALRASYAGMLSDMADIPRHEVDRVLRAIALNARLV